MDKADAPESPNQIEQGARSNFEQDPSYWSALATIWPQFARTGVCRLSRSHDHE